VERLCQPGPGRQCRCGPRHRRDKRAWRRSGLFSPRRTSDRSSSRSG